MARPSELLKYPSSLAQRAIDLIFGNDFFISHSHADGIEYPKALKTQLEQLGFKVFLDSEGFSPGIDLHRETRRQIAKSSKLIVVGRTGALQSKWVAQEVEIALSKKKIPLIIDINNALELNAKLPLALMAIERQWFSLREQLVAKDMAPSDHVVAEVARSLRATRQEAKRQRVLVSTVMILVTTHPPCGCMTRV
jgi:hypothetical protein